MGKIKPRSDMRVYLRGHCARIGDGWRGVQIVKLGYKWASFRDTASCRTCKVLRSAWDKLAANAYDEGRS